MILEKGLCPNGPWRSNSVVVPFDARRFYSGAGLDSQNGIADQDCSTTLESLQGSQNAARATSALCQRNFLEIPVTHTTLELQRGRTFFLRDSPSRPSRTQNYRRRCDNLHQQRRAESPKPDKTPSRAQHLLPPRPYEEVTIGKMVGPIARGSARSFRLDERSLQSPQSSPTIPVAT